MSLGYQIVGSVSNSLSRNSSILLLRASIGRVQIEALRKAPLEIQLQGVSPRADPMFAALSCRLFMCGKGRSKPILGDRWAGELAQCGHLLVKQPDLTCEAIRNC